MTKTILHVIDTTGPGGAEVVFITLAERLARRGHRSIALIRGPGWVQDELRRRGIEPVVIDAKGSFNLRYVRELVRLIRHERVDVVQSHLLGSNVYCALAGWLTHTPVVGTFHGMVDIRPDERFRRAKLWVLQRGIRRYVAVSRSLAEAVAREGLLDPARTSVIYNGIDTARYARGRAGQLRARLGLPEDAIITGSVGNVRPAKAYDVLIEAAARLLPAHPGLHFVIAGHIKRDLMATLERLMHERGVAERVHFIGFADDTAAFLSDVDVFVLSSSSEGFSLSVVEALASGLPAVVTRCGGPEEIATADHDALMVPTGDPAALAQAIERVLSDPALAARLGAAGRKTVRRRFEVDAMVAAYETLYP